MFAFNYDQASTAPYTNINVDPSIARMFEQAGAGATTGMTGALQAPGLRMPANAVSKIQAEMNNFGRIGAATGGLGYELARSHADYDQSSAAARARSLAGIDALNMNQSMMRSQMSNDLAGQSRLLQFLSPLFGSMYQQAGLGY